MNGVQLIQASVRADGQWYYAWNPGFSLQSGSYTIVVTDASKTMSARAGFSVVGGGQVTVATSRYSYGIGDTVIFSGLCTTGARSVILTLTGPQQFTNGVSLGTQAVTADNLWNYRYADFVRNACRDLHDISPGRPGNSIRFSRAFL